MRSRVVARLSIALLTAFGAAQFVRPDTTNPPVAPEKSLWTDKRVDKRVSDILRRSCADCHSHETAWPWYSKISPFSWLVARHVEKGRAKLNFSDWSGPDSDQMEEIYDSVAKQKMPLASYLIIHRSARLTKEDKEILTAWVDGKLTPVTSAGNLPLPKP